MNKLRWLAVPISLILAVAGLVAAAPAAHADDIRHFQVAFTNGLGVRLRTAAHVDAPGVGVDGKYGIPEGGWFPAECEEYGDSVTNVYGETSNIYLRAPGGLYVSSVWLNTGTNSRVGLPLCSELDAALLASVTPKKVSDYQREGRGVVILANPEHTSARAYFSKAKTKEAAGAFNSANNRLFWSGTLLCAVGGAIIGVATAGGSVVVETVGGAALGLGADIGCSAATNALTPEEFTRGMGAANAAASADKCLEVRMHKDSTDKWVSDTWTVTDHGDYCS